MTSEVDLSELENTFLPHDPLRRLEGATREPFPATRRVPQRDRVRRRIKADLVRFANVVKAAGIKIE